MNNELKISSGKNTYSVFLQEGFYVQDAKASPLHKHYHTEIQFILDGAITCIVENKKFELKSGNVLAIPANTIHYSENVKPGTQMSAFLINKKIDKTTLLNFPSELIGLFFKEIEKSLETNNYSKVLGFINLFCCYFFDSNPQFESSVNYAFTIEDFFTLNYSNNVKLSDLAKNLNLSEKQVARLVYKYTGNNFTDEITKRRMEIAEILLSTTDLSKKAISEYVGYDSYSGFYKAYEKFTKSKKSDN